MAISDKYNWIQLSPEEEGFEYFFGYYDRCAWDMDDKLHLALRVKQMLRIPERGETADIGVLDRQGNFTKLVTTRTWCHQQASMQLFLPRNPGSFVYNDFDEKENKMVARIYTIGNGITGRYNRPLYTITPDGKYGASLDFSRIPRRGYSYADAVLSTDRFPRDLDADGLWLVDLETGEDKLIVSYRTMLERHPYAFSCKGQHIWLNHAIFNATSDRVLWLFRQCEDTSGDKGCWWKTFMYTSDLTGKDAACILPEPYWRGMISHQIWGRTRNEILVDAKWNSKTHSAVVLEDNVNPFISQEISPSHGGMSHMVFSPDGKTIAADGYPLPCTTADGKTVNCQVLCLIDVESGKVTEIGKFRHRQPEGTTVDVRCDIHPRWSRDGKTITVDSIHSGKRAIYMLDVTQLVK